MRNSNNKKLKIAFVSDAIYPHNKGGKEKRIYEISTRLAKRGHNVYVYCMKWWKGKENNRIENGVHIHAISRYYPLYFGKRRSIKEAVMFAFACLKLVKEDFDIIDVDHMPHFVLFSTKIVCILKRRKMIASWNEVWGREYWKEYLGKLGSIAYLIEKLSIFMPDKIISISELTTDKLRNELLSKKDIVTIPVGVDFDYIQKIKPSPTKSDVIFAGRLLSHKNVDVLIKSIAILKKNKPHIKCLVIGDGPEKKRLEKVATVLDITKNVSFLGFLENHDELYSLIKSSKVFVLPSSREGFGVVAIEALACNIPVVTVNQPDNAAKNIIAVDFPNLISELNACDLSLKIIEAINLPIEFKDKLTSIAGKYNWNKIVGVIEDAYLK